MFGAGRCAKCYIYDKAFIRKCSICLDMLTIIIALLGKKIFYLILDSSTSQALLETFSQSMFSLKLFQTPDSQIY